MNREEKNQQASMDRLTSRANKQVDDVVGKINDAATRVGDQVEASLDAIETKVRDLRDSLSDAGDQYAKNTKRYVRRNPWTVAGVSAGIAFLAGLFVSRKKKH